MLTIYWIIAVAFLLLSLDNNPHTWPLAILTSLGWPLMVLLFLGMAWYTYHQTNKPPL